MTKAADNAFTDLKSRLASRPILKPTDYEKPLLIAVDASTTCLGAVLFQIQDGLEHRVCYLRSNAKRNSTTQQWKRKLWHWWPLSVRLLSISVRRLCLSTRITAHSDISTVGGTIMPSYADGRWKCSSSLLPHYPPSTGTQQLAPGYPQSSLGLRRMLCRQGCPHQGVQPVMG